jgi:cytochrome c553
MATLLVLAAFLLPEEVVVRVAQLFDTPAADADAFDTVIVEIDEALAGSGQVPVSREQFGSYHRHVAARRLAAAGKVTGEDIRRAAAIFGDFQQRIDSEKTEGSKDAMRSLRNETLSEALPRVELSSIDRALNTLRDQISAAAFVDSQPPKESAEPAQTGDSGKKTDPAPSAAGGDCATCHLEFVDLPGPTLDVDHLWPELPAEKLADGTRLPNMMSAAEVDSCGECHAPHGSPNFGVDDKMRADNVGLWVHVHEFEGLVRVQAKLQNIDASHRIPAGKIPRAYALVVKATQDGEALSRWWGPTLPDHLRDLGESGLFLGRSPVDRNGRFTTNLDAIHDIKHDTRLEPGRFYDEYFLFKAPESGTVKVEATVVFLPDSATPEATPIQTVSKKLVVTPSLR